MSEQDIKQIVVNAVTKQAQEVLEQSKYPEALATHLSSEHITPVGIFPIQPQYDIVEFDPQALMEAMSTEELETAVAAVTEVVEKMPIPQLTTQHSFEEICERLRAMGGEPKMSIKNWLLPTTGMALTGRIFGFPECCVEAFCNDREVLSEESVFSGSGFRPCKHCNDNKTQEQIENEIASRRLIPYPFYHRPQDALPDRFYRDYFDLEEELYNVLKTLSQLLSNFPELLDLAKDCWVPVEQELRCYVNRFGGKEPTYYFASKYQNRRIPVLTPDGEVVNAYLNKKCFRTGRLVDGRKAAMLREQYPELYANRDFKFDTGKFSELISQRLFSISREESLNGSV